MGEIDFDSTRVLVALVAVVAGVLSMAAALRLTAQLRHGFFQYFAYAVLLSQVVSVFFSGRSLSLDDEIQSRLLAQNTAVSSWTIRLTSVFLVLASLERIVNYGLRRNRSGSAPYPLLLAFVAFWCATVASPAVLGAQGSFSHDYLYALLMGCAALLLSQRESDGTVVAARNGLMIFLAISAALIPLRPTLVMDWHYAGGLLPGVPRFAGLAPHPVSLGMLAQLGLLCLYAKPLSQHWLNRLCWALGLFTLFLAQSKASWLSFPVCAACIFWMRGDVAAWRRSSDARLRLSSLFLPLTVLLVTVVLGLIYIFGNLGLTIDSFWTGHRAADLLSFTGRDRIWAVALEEWTRHPVFGYGSNLWDEGYRADIGMPFAFDGHNQLVDALARSGLVGAAGLMLYATSLLVYSVKHARATRGFCLAIFLAIALRSVAEVPLGLFRYGPEALQHFLLLAILAGKARARSAPAGGHSAAGPLPLTQRG